MLPSYFWFQYLDQWRRAQGRALDRLGLGPQESPFHIVFEQPGLRLRWYGNGAAGKPPLLIVPAPPSGGIVPAESVTAFHHAAGSEVKELAAYPGDVGVALQHVGPLVGRNAHRDIWPRVFAWLDRISSSG